MALQVPFRTLLAPALGLGTGDVLAALPLSLWRRTSQVSLTLVFARHVVVIVRRAAASRQALHHLAPDSEAQN